MQLSRDRSITPFFTRKQFLTLSILFLFLIVSTFVVRDLYVNDLSTHWNDIRQAREREVSQEIQSKFSDYERQAFTDVDAIAALSETGHLFSIYDDSTQQAYFFEKVLPLIPADKPIEVYDLDGGLVGWSGTRGPSLDMSKLKRERKSFVLQDPIYSYLTVVVPVFVNDSVQGYVIGRRLIEVNYPINNRFISSRGFAGTFATQLPWPVEFEFLTNTKMLHDSLRIAIEIKNLAGEHVGYGFVSREDLSSQTDLVSLNADHVAELLTVGLLVIILVQIVTLPRIRESVLLHLVAATTALWMLRYFLVWVDFPSAYFQWSIFDPMKFASPFGFGIAKSIGDMFLSAIVLGISVSLITVTYLRTESRAWIARIIRGSKIIAFTLLVGSGLVLAGFIRAFGATIHSAVFDSNLPYNDPAFVLPSLDLTVMLLSMIVIAISFILASMILLSLAWHFSRHLSSRNRSAWLRSGWLVLVFSLIALFFGRLQENPLVTPLERLCYIAGLAIITLLISFVYQKRRQVMSAVSVLGIFLAAVALLVSMLDTKVHALDRVQVELIANEIGRPADSWLTLLVNQSLSELAGPDAATALIDADTVDLQPLAFTQWAKSTLSKEGNNCSITYVNRDEAVVSDFHIGVPPHEYTKHTVVVPAVSPSVSVEEKTINGRIVKWYVGYALIESQSGDVVGGVRVEVSGSRQTMFGGGAPEFLRSDTRENFETHYRPLILSEYYDRKLLYTTNETIPLSRSFPQVILSRLDRSKPGVWVDEEIDGQQYESYYFPEQGASANKAWIVLSMPALDARWHAYSFLRYIIFYLLLAVVSLLILAVARMLRGERISASFRLKLMAAFVIVSLIPVIILVYYNRQYAIEQAEELMTKRLSEQTLLVESEVREILVGGVPAALTQLRDEQCAEIANDVDVDFTIYYGSLLQASSKPEMFTAELLDTRLSAAAYGEIVLKKKKFFLEYQRIGTLPYVVGYRPLLAEDGSVMGVVSVPSLYRQIEINQDSTRRSMFLYGAYAVALVLSVIVGTMFANQISLPIRRLMAATRQIGTGKLDVQLQHQRRDELGKLEQAFHEMTNDLKRTQQEMMKAQRESAWREMAKQVAHEIKNPLTPMKLSVQHLRQAYRDGMKDFGSLLEQVSNTLLEQIETLSRIASEFSHFARMPERVIEPCLVNDVLLEARNLFQHENIHFDVELDRSSSTVQADREELRRVFINIIRNAVQAVERSGNITLKTKTSDGFVEINVTDTGPGIRPEILSRLFEPNFSTKTDGMGLGLPIVKRIIDDLGGTIDVQSTPGSGTAVYIRLPIQRMDV